MPRKHSALAAGAVLAAGPASAHSTLPGLEGFYAGITLPVAEPALGIATGALALAAAQAGTERIPRHTAVFLCALLAGFGAAATGVLTPPVEMALLGMALVSALTTAAGLAGTVAVPLLAAATGALAGITALPDPGSGDGWTVTTAGGLIGPLLMFLVISGALDALRERIGGQVAAIGLRIFAAWIAAVALMMLALLLGPGPV